MNQLTAITHPDSSIETLTYDDNGNLVQTTRNGKITSYEWDCFDRLKKVTLPDEEIVEFAYDSDGMLVRQESEGTERKFIQNNRYASRELVKNKQGDWEPTATHIIHGTMLASYQNSTSINPGNGGIKGYSGNMAFYHTDHLGSVRLITDENGNITQTISTDAYGNPLPHADSSGNKGAKMLSEFNFIGTYGIRYVEKVKLHNMRARWYEKDNLRFLSFDKENELNKYIYTRNNPIVRIDPSGLLSIYIARYKGAPNRLSYAESVNLIKNLGHKLGGLAERPNLSSFIKALIENDLIFICAHGSDNYQNKGAVIGDENPGEVIYQKDLDLILKGDSIKDIEISPTEKIEQQVWDQLKGKKVKARLISLLACDTKNVGWEKNFIVGKIPAFIGASSYWSEPNCPKFISCFLEYFLKPTSTTYLKLAATFSKMPETEGTGKSFLSFSL